MAQLIVEGRDPAEVWKQAARVAIAFAVLADARNQNAEGFTSYRQRLLDCDPKRGE